MSELIRVVAWLCVIGAAFVLWLNVRKSGGTRERSRMRMERVVAELIAMKERDGAWPACDGKNFVLAAVAGGALDVELYADRQALFSVNAGLVALPEAARYGGVTMDRLRDGEDFHELTSFAGRRNATLAYAMPRNPSEPEPLVADDHLPNVVIVGYSDGSVRVHSYAQLGLPDIEDTEVYRRPTGHLVFGDRAASPLLKKLSRK